MQVVACYAIKGGVGKTVCAVNLAYIAATQGRRTLLWDLEAQGASSFYFRIKPKLKGGGAALLGAGRGGLNDLIKGSDFAQLDVLPADFSCRNLDLLLDQYKKPAQRLRKLLKPLRGEYDVVFLDCPPSAALLTEAVFAAADVVLAPLTPSPFSLENLQRLQKFAAEQQFDAARLLPFISMLDRRKPLHRETELRLRAECGNVLATAIPYAAGVERMAAERLPLGEFAGKTAVARAYAKLWEEVVQQLLQRQERDDADGAAPE